MGSDPIAHVDAREALSLAAGRRPRPGLPFLRAALTRAIYSVAVMACTAIALRGQAPEIETARDTIVMRHIAYRAPCPNPAPRAWSVRDSSLGSGLRCSLVEAAARAVRRFLEMRPPLTGPADPWNPLCVRLIVASNTGSTGLPGDWMVIFDLAPDVIAHAVIDRQEGTIPAARVSFGSPPPTVPRCMA